jgi:uncharacterized protein with NAD-binding domain and iron-sulfur cluster
LVDQNWGDVPLLQVDLYESRPFIGGKVGSFVDRKGNHIEMGLHVFFGCYSNLFRLMKKVIFYVLSDGWRMSTFQVFC